MSSLFQPIAYYLGPGLGVFLLIALLPLIGYLVWRLCTVMLQAQQTTSTTKQDVRTLTRSVGLFLFGLLVLMSLSGLLITVVDTWPIQQQQVASVAKNNNTLMEIDRAIFGTYPTLWLQAHDNTWSPIIAKATGLLQNTYFGLTPLFGVIALLLLITHTHLFFRLVAVFFLVVFMSVPFWLAFPATSPVVAYWYPIFEQPTSEAVQSALASYAPNEELTALLNRLGERRSDLAHEMLVLTTIPSMHIAWVTALVWYAWQAWPLTLALGIPYFALNSVSTVYLLQHYAIDTPAGILIALLAIIAVHELKPERLAPIRVIHSYIRRDTASVVEQLRSMRRFGSSISGQRRGARSGIDS